MSNRTRTKGLFMTDDTGLDDQDPFSDATAEAAYREARDGINAEKVGFQECTPHPDNYIDDKVTGVDNGVQRTEEMTRQDKEDFVKGVRELEDRFGSTIKDLFPETRTRGAEGEQATSGDSWKPKLDYKGSREGMDMVVSEFGEDAESLMSQDALGTLHGRIS